MGGKSACYASYLPTYLPTVARGGEGGEGARGLGISKFGHRQIPFQTDTYCTRSVGAEIGLRLT